MRKILILAVVAIVIAAAASARAAKQPGGSFLNDRVTTVDQLAQQVVNDAIVAARYAKHFRMPRNSVVDYFQNNLRAAKLLADYETTVYVISEKTDAVAIKKTLAKGTYIFVMKNGQPLLEASTGNPLEDHLPVLLTTEPNTVLSPSADSAEQALQETSSLPTQDNVVSRVLGNEPAEIGTIAPMAISANMAAAQPAIELVSAIPIQSAPASIMKVTRVLPIVAALGGAAALAGGGSSTKDTGSPDNVPEPSSIAALMLGASGLVLTKYRLRR